MEEAEAALEQEENKVIMALIVIDILIVMMTTNQKSRVCGISGTIKTKLPLIPGFTVCL